MNRQERRERKRLSDKFDKRTHFTKAELDYHTKAAYNLAVSHMLRACYIGPKREAKVLQRLDKIKDEVFGEYQK